MCEPTTIAVIGLLLTAGTAAYTIDAGNKAADAQEEQAAENAKAANTQADNAILTGQIDEDRQRQRTRAIIASQRTSFAANNLDMSTGTPLEILGDTAAMGEQDALTIRANAARTAWGYRSQGVGYTNEGNLAQATAKNNATATLLTTAGSMANQYGKINANRSTSAPSGTTTTGGWKGPR